MPRSFIVAHNPDELSKLGYLLWLPIDQGIVLKSGATWPATARVFCQQIDGWPEQAEVVEETDVASIRRRGAAIDLVLARGRNKRSQFVFTRLKGGRPAIFWQTAKTARTAKPGTRVPTRRAWGAREVVIARDTRERYGYRFPTQQASVEPAALAAGDYALRGPDGETVAAVERKTVANLVAALVDGSLTFQLAELAEVPHAAVVVEGDYADLLEHAHTQPGWLVDLLGRVQVRYPSVPIVFAGSRKLGEEYTFRFLGAARAEMD